MYEKKEYTHLLGTEGFSDDLLNNHFMLYEGYVKNTNKSIELLEKYEKDGNTATPEYAETKRRFGWEFNGMRLHEYYFGNMSKENAEAARAEQIQGAIKEQFGSFDEWLRRFKAVAGMRGIGWTVLYYDPESKRMFNVWVDEHDMGHLAGAKPLLVLDVFEHAYTLDYGIKKPDYLDVFVSAINWMEVEERFNSVK